MAIEIEEVRSTGRWTQLAREWEEALVRCGEDPVFLCLDWLLPWWNTFGDRRELMVLHATENNHTVGFAPFMITSRGRISTWRKLEFIGSGPSDRLGIIARDGRSDVHRAFWDHVKSSDDWDVVELRDMAAGGPTEAVVREGYPCAEYCRNLSPHIILGASYEDYLNELSKNMRYNLGRSRRKLEDMGVVFRTLRSKEEVAEGVHYLKKLSDARWDIANVLKGPNMVEFIEAASTELAKRSMVVFHTLELKDDPLAICMGFESNGRYMYYLSGFDPERAKASPGSVLLSRIIEECCASGKKEVDLMRGTEPYKYRFKAVDRVQYHFRALNKGILRSARCAMMEAPLN
ncbi:MAG: GNAT family N-acetyltransferase [Methanomassiliicoccus sp.]|nr:GNAT family N-acetyltransferase [Methanomassiliicoccus sp.]